jgi:hypothetical protein
VLFRSSYATREFQTDRIGQQPGPSRAPRRCRDRARPDAHRRASFPRSARHLQLRDARGLVEDCEAYSHGALGRTNDVAQLRHANRFTPAALARRTALASPSVTKVTVVSGRSQPSGTRCVRTNASPYASRPRCQLPPTRWQVRSPRHVTERAPPTGTHAIAGNPLDLDIPQRSAQDGTARCLHQRRCLHVRHSTAPSETTGQRQSERLARCGLNPWRRG